MRLDYTLLQGSSKKEHFFTKKFSKWNVAKFNLKLSGGYDV